MQCGVVHQHVDLTKAAQDLYDHVLHLCRGCHIGLHREAFTAQGTDGILHRYSCIGAANIVNRYMGAFGC
jgi:hypothetical protein